MSRETVSAWVDRDDLDDVLEEHGLKNASDLLQKVAETDELRIVSDAGGGYSSTNAEQKPDVDRMDTLEKRISGVEEDARESWQDTHEKVISQKKRIDQLERAFEQEAGVSPDEY